MQKQRWTNEFYRWINEKYEYFHIKGQKLPQDSLRYFLTYTTKA